MRRPLPYRFHGSRAANRAFAASVAIALNLSLWYALTSVLEGPLSHASAAEATTPLLWISLRPISSEGLRPVKPERPSHRSPVPVLTTAQNVPKPIGPPAETPHSLSSLPPERVARVVDVLALGRICSKLASSLGLSPASGTAVELRIFVMADGHVAQSSLTTTSGDEQLDVAIRTCVEANANVEPTIVDEHPIAGWQELVFAWPEV